MLSLAPWGSRTVFSTVFNSRIPVTGVGGGGGGSPGGMLEILRWRYCVAFDAPGSVRPLRNAHWQVAGRISAALDRNAWRDCGSRGFARRYASGNGRNAPGRRGEGAPARVVLISPWLRAPEPARSPWQDVLRWRRRGGGRGPGLQSASRAHRSLCTSSHFRVNIAASGTWLATHGPLQEARELCLYSHQERHSCFFKR